jgi:hypothetical protein
MARLNPSQEELYIIKCLYDEVRDRFDQQWEKEWLNHGPKFEGFHNVHNKSRFFDEIKDVIDNKLAQQFGLLKASDKSISIDSIRRFLLKTKGGFDSKVLEAFLILIDEEPNWELYMNKILSQKKIIEVKTHHTRVKGWIIGFLFLSLCMAVYLNTMSTSSKQPELTVKLFSNKPGMAKVLISYNLQGVSYEKAHLFFNDQKINLKAERGDTLVNSALPQWTDVSLFLDGVRAKTESILIPSDGWVGYINQNILLKPEIFRRGDTMQYAGFDTIKERFGSEYYTSFMNFRPFGMSGDSFTLEADLINSKEIGGIWAYDVSVDIIGRENSIVFNLLHPDATLFSVLRVGESNFEEDISLHNLGVDLSFWRRLKVFIQEQTIKIVLDDELLIEKPFLGSIGEIVGLQFYFKGSGAVKNIQLNPLETDLKSQ